jgi:hypothetical protein
MEVPILQNSLLISLLAGNLVAETVQKRRYLVFVLYRYQN